MPAGTVLEPGRFSYIGLDGAHRGLLVTTGVPGVTLRSAGTVLVLSTSDLQQLAPMVPLLRTRLPDPERYELCLAQLVTSAGAGGATAVGAT